MTIAPKSSQFALGAFVFALHGLAFGADGLEVVRTTLPQYEGLGYYVPLRAGEPKNLTYREGQDPANRRRPPELDRTKPLIGFIEYSEAHGVSIVIQDNQHGGVNEKLRQLSGLDPAAVRAFVCMGVINSEGMGVLGTFSQMRDLMIQTSDTLERPEGASLLANLKELECLQVVPRDDQKFGSTKFCEAILSLKKLKYLSMPSEKLTDANVKTLAEHPTLERIWLHATKPVLGRGSLQALNRMPRLRELFIVCTEDITDADVMGFAEIRSLELLRIATEAPLTCLERIKARRPDCEIYFPQPFNELE